MDESQKNSVGQNLHVLPHSLRAMDGDRAIQAPILYTFEAPTQIQTQSSNSLIMTQQNLDHHDGSSTGESGSHNSARLSALLASDDSNLLEPNGSNIERFLHLSKSSGELRLLRVWPADWSNGPLTLVVRATQADNRDRYTLTTLTITNKGSSQTTTKDSSSNSRSNNGNNKNNNQLQFLTNKVIFSVPESASINERIGQVKAVLMTNNNGLQSTDSINSPDSSMNESVDLISSSQTNLNALPVGGQGHQPGDEWQRQPRNYNQPNSNSKSTINNNSKQRLSGRQAIATTQSSNALNRGNALSQATSVNYQILDDQTDQFGVNQSGEIFLKKSLDYEQRQEFLFRILATHSRFSDICLVQVNVMNVNDNKPKVSHRNYSNFTLFERDGRKYNYYSYYLA